VSRQWQAAAPSSRSGGFMEPEGGGSSGFCHGPGKNPEGASTRPHQLLAQGGVIVCRWVQRTLRRFELDRRDHLLFQQGDFLLAIGLLDPGAAQRQPSPQRQDPPLFSERTFRCDWPAERRGSSRKHGHGLGAESGAVKGPDPSGGLTSGRPQTGEARSKTRRVEPNRGWFTKGRPPENPLSLQ
jgi:hypothetical protein